MVKQWYINHQYYNIGYYVTTGDISTYHDKWHNSSCVLASLDNKAWYIDSQTRGAPLPRVHCEVTECKPQNCNNELACRMRPLDASSAVWDASTSPILAARTCGSTWLSIVHVTTNYGSCLLKAKTLATVIGSCGVGSCLWLLSCCPFFWSAHIALWSKLELAQVVVCCCLATRN